ncbi:MAG: hypothetical protein ACRD8Z_09060, partial [Nitrososphaeraceae archaeon]
AISYVLSIIMFGLLAAKFFTWHRSNRNFLILLYGSASASLAISGLFTVVLATSIFSGLPSQTLPHVGFNSPSLIPGSLSHLLSFPYIISNILSFVLTWLATAALLLYYSKKLRELKYWIVVAMPLIYFVTPMLPWTSTISFLLAESNVILSSILSTLIFALSNPVGGILFGLAFWIATRSLEHNSPVKRYMAISAYGFVLFFTTNQAIVLVSAPYPPFGMPTILFVGLSSYLVLIGIYCTAISISQDAKLRQSIRRLAQKESSLLDSIGLAQVSGEVQSRVITLTKRYENVLKEESGISSSLSDDEIKQYLQEVLQEVKRSNE